MKKVFVHLVLVLALSLISCGGGGGGGGGTPPAPDNFGAILSQAAIAETSNEQTGKPESAEEFWTRERIQKAMENPLDMIIDPPSQKQEIQEMLPETNGTPKSSEPFIPNGSNRNFLIDKKMGSSLAEASVAKCPASYYETGYFRDYSRYPESTQGMLAMRKGKVLSGVCSATLIGRNLIMTAAHCVAKNGEWYTDWAFVPAFNGSSDNWKPYGIGYAKYAFIYSGWFNNQYYPADVAFIVLKQPLGDQAGWLGFKVNQAREQTWLQVGYPAEYPYEWVTLAYNISSYGYDECRAGTPCLMAVGSLLTKGSSGGPWVMDHIYVSGLNSFKYTDCLLTMNSPYFGNKVWDLYQMAQTYQ